MATTPIQDAAAQLVRNNGSAVPATTTPQAEFERKADPSDPQASELLQQMRAYVSKVGRVVVGIVGRWCSWQCGTPRWKRPAQTRTRG